jgi:uncharacterized protein YidB (DUF937 family)
MARSGFPSMTALLGLLAVAGYQNRDRIAEMMRQGGGDGRGASPGAGTSGGLGGLLGGLAGGGGSSSGGLGGLLGGGLGELERLFRGKGRAEHVDSWVGTGPNRDISIDELNETLGPDVLADLTEATGLSREEVLQRLSRELPQAVDRYTPQGRLPGRDEFG